MSQFRRSEIMRIMKQFNDGLSLLGKDKSDSSEMLLVVPMIAAPMQLLIGIASDLNEINERLALDKRLPTDPV